MAEHSIWAGVAPPWEPTAHTDGDPSIRTATAFYATATTWYVAGGRVRVPASSGFGLVTLSLRITPNGVLPDLAAAPVASAQVMVGATAGWYEARWETPVELVAPAAAWIAMETAAGDGYLFVSPEQAGSAPVQASDGADWYMAEQAHPRSAYRVGSDPTAFSHAVYVTDAIVTDDPDGPSPTGGSVAGVAVSVAGGGRARHAGASGAALGVTVAGAGRKRARAGSTPGVAMSAVGAGYNPANLPDELPTTGTLGPLTPARGAVALTPPRGLEPA